MYILHCHRILFLGSHCTCTLGFSVKMGCYSKHSDVSVLGQSLTLLSSILTILLTCPNYSDTLMCYSNDPFLTMIHALHAITSSCGSKFERHPTVTIITTNHLVKIIGNGKAELSHSHRFSENKFYCSAALTARWFIH